MVNFGFTYWMEIGEDGFRQMAKRTDDIVFRVVSVLIGFMALRSSVEKKVSATMVFKDDFMDASYYAVGHVLVMLCGAATKAYSSNIRIFDEVQIISGLVLCVKLTLELYTDETINRFPCFSGWFLVVIAFSSLIMVPLYKFRAWLRQNLWDPVLTILSTADPIVIIKEHWKWLIAAVILILVIFGCPAALYFALNSFNAGNRAETSNGDYESI